MSLIILLLVSITSISATLNSHPEDSLIAYDCLHEDTKVSTLSLLSPPPCKKIQRSYKNDKILNGQLLQTKRIISVKYRQCKVEREIRIFRCAGLYSYMYDVPESYIEDLILPSSEACKDLHQTKVLITSSMSRIDGLTMNGTTAGSEIIAGGLDWDGKCSGGTWSHRSKTWHQVIVKAFYRISLYEGYAPVLMESNKISLPGDVTCNYDLDVTPCIHIIYGSTFWDKPVLSCEEKSWVILYTGQVRYRKQPGDIGSLITHEGEDTSFALETKGRTSLCGRPIIKTAHMTLMILLERDGSTLLPAQNDFMAENMDFSLYVNTKFIYFDLNIKKELESIYDLFAIHQCEVDRKTINNLQTLAYISGPEFAYALKNSPGYTAEIRGEVAHIFSCIPVSVRIRALEGCYSEIPVDYKNTSMFLTPRNRILTRYATEVDCSPLLPVMYNLGTNWYNLYPHPIVTKQPDVLNSLVFPNFTYKSPKGLASGGIYSAEKLKSYQDRILLGNEREALSTTLARGYAGQPLMMTQGSLLSLLNGVDYNTLSENLTSKAWSWIYTFSHLGAAIYGVSFTFTILVKLLNSGASAYAIASKFGWTWRLLLCWWTSLVHIFILRSETNNKNEKPSDLPETSLEMNLLEGHNVISNNDYHKLPTSPVLLNPENYPHLSKEEVEAMYPRL